MLQRNEKLANALFPFLCRTQQKNKRACNNGYGGEVVSKIAESDLEFARTVMRRLMLSLTEESGGIGSGVAEAMGEIMARNEKSLLKNIIRY